MEYEFIHDPMGGGAKAKFSLEHEVFGPWLETEVGDQLAKITTLLEAIDKAGRDHSYEGVITGHEYSVIINHCDVTVKSNMCMNGAEVMPENLVDDELSFDGQGEAQCGVEDFRALLLSWSRFNKH